MKIRSIAAAVVAVLLVNTLAFAAVDTRKNKAKKRQTSRLVTLLPASDGVAVFDAKRFLDDALPRVLSANQPMLGEIMAKINEMENRTGIDLRKFDQVAVGVAFKQISAKETDYEPILIAGGDINAGALVAVAKLASKGTYREEKIGERTVYVFALKDVVQKSTKPTTSKVGGMIDDALKGLSKEIAVTSIDANTLAIGTLPRVRETLEGKTHASADLTSLLSQKETAVMSFATRIPGGMSALLPLDNDEIGNNINSIQVMAGSLDVAASGTNLQVMARTAKADQAQSLKEMLDGLKMLGGAILGGSKRSDQQVYSRMIKNAKIASRANEVTLDLLVPQADIDILVASIK
ncbi:MAG TPA: hypothetical protein PLL77_11905 [Pyrinomonadaceae bacterium]|nr:hypothetical protein [Pyrinomonadaceae bacterium]